ncbi:MAG: lysophospholipid acyltransferase family protein [Chloracidobacterium sp.]|nr:lysophospholipid acyltransferase family protein [Chloracidobacterium sp.]MDW8216946.1 lysophospholipid acyltransferase family protein [Acidobacteriota bacterium]
MLTTESATVNPSAAVRRRIEALAVTAILRGLGVLPHRWARGLGVAAAGILALALPRLRRVGLENLALAFPDLSARARRRLWWGCVANLGRLLGEFSQFPKLHAGNIAELVEYEGFEYFEAARAQGRGVIFFTGHLGAWELSAYAHALYGHPLTILVRPIDNPLVDALVTRYRTGSGNRLLSKHRELRALVAALRRGETVGILADVHVQPQHGVFCEFFGRPASTSPLVARLARRTGAAVVLGYLVWDAARKRHRLIFEPPPALVRTADEDFDVRENTARLTRRWEAIVRRHPDQWLWIHRRWKSQPAAVMSPAVADDATLMTLGND